MTPPDSATKLAAATLAAAIIAGKGKPVAASTAVSLYREVLGELSRAEAPIQ